MTPTEVFTRNIDYYLSLPPESQNPDLLTILKEYKSNIMRMVELDAQLRQLQMRILMQDMPAANDRPI